jgi:hypothetical protein
MSRLMKKHKHHFRYPKYQGFPENMSSVDEPTCGTAGCFSGLISIVANDIPELKDSYGYKTFYFFQGWAKALNEYLDINFRKWAEENPETWGNEGGWYMFNSITAFDKEEGDVSWFHVSFIWVLEFVAFILKINPPIVRIS